MNVPSMTKETEHRAKMDTIGEQNCGAKFKDKEYDFYIISDDVEWEDKLLQDLSKEKPDVKCLSRRDRTLCKFKMENLTEPIQRCKKVVIGFTSISETFNPEFVAVTVVQNMLESKNLGRVQLIPVKITKDAVIPKCLDTLTVANNWEKGFCQKLIATLPQQENSLVRFKTHGQLQAQDSNHDFYIISDNVEWEDKVLQGLLKVNPDVKCLSRKDWQLSKLKIDNLIEPVQRCKKVVVGFTPQSLTCCPELVAATAVMAKIGNSILGKLIPVKVTEDSKIPLFLKPLSLANISNGWDKDFCNKLQSTTTVQHEETVTEYVRKQILTDNGKKTTSSTMNKILNDLIPNGYYDFYYDDDQDHFDDKQYLNDDQDLYDFDNQDYFDDNQGHCDFDNQDHFDDNQGHCDFDNQGHFDDNQGHCDFDNQDHFDDNQGHCDFDNQDHFDDNQGHCDFDNQDHFDDNQGHCDFDNQDHFDDNQGHCDFDNQDHFDDNQGHCDFDNQDHFDDNQGHCDFDNQDHFDDNQGHCDFDNQDHFDDNQGHCDFDNQDHFDDNQGHCDFDNQDHFDDNQDHYDFGNQDHFDDNQDHYDFDNQDHFDDNQDHYDFGNEE
ncbi:uncharacterized protein [Antedon mediterranea]|uniref:uncharacterized protein n=1 Tax=Antedon mediterranea TaxID=105859 RepID=UPI003AF882C7